MLIINTIKLNKRKAVIGIIALVSVATIMFNELLPLLIFIIFLLISIDTRNIKGEFNSKTKNLDSKLSSIERKHEQVFNYIKIQTTDFQSTLNRHEKRLTKKIETVELNSYFQYESREKLKLLLTEKQFNSLDSLRGWAIAPDTAVLLYELVKNSRKRSLSIVEMGSGSSTIVFASALANEKVRGHVYSLEHNSEYAQKTRNNLQTASLDGIATIIDSPIGSIQLDNEERKWFSSGSLDELPDEVDILFIDSPPKSTAALARYPAVPLLYDRLCIGSIIILDDYLRDDEKKMVKLWTDRYTGMKLNELTKTDHGTAMLYVESK